MSTEDFNNALKEYREFSNEDLTIEELSTFCNEHPDFALCLADTARAYFNRKEIQAGKKYLLRSEKLLRYLPENSEANFIKAYCFRVHAEYSYFINGNIRNMEKYALKCEEASPKESIPLLYLAGRIFYSNKDYQRAIKYYKKAFNYDFEFQECNTQDIHNYLELMFTANDEYDPPLLEKYIQKPDCIWINDLDKKLTLLYEEKQKYELAMLTSFLSYELYSCYFERKNEDFMNMQRSFAAEINDKYNRDLSFIIDFFEKYFDDGKTLTFDDVQKLPEECRNYFPVRFMLCTKSQMTQNIAEKDFLPMSAFFRQFPSFYYHLYNSKKSSEELKKICIRNLINVDKINGICDASGMPLHNTYYKELKLDGYNLND